MFLRIRSRTPLVVAIAPSPPHTVLKPRWTTALRGTIQVDRQKVKVETSMYDSTHGCSSWWKDIFVVSTVTTLEPLVSPDAKKTIETNMNSGEKRPEKHGMKPVQQLKTTVPTGVRHRANPETPLPMLKMTVTSTTRTTDSRQASTNPETTHSLTCDMQRNGPRQITYARQWW